MRYLITLKFAPSEATLAQARELLEPFGLVVDVAYGLVIISPKRGLYVVRVEGGINNEQLSALPEVVGVHGEVKIAPIQQSDEEIR